MQQIDQQGMAARKGQHPAAAKECMGQGILLQQGTAGKITGSKEKDPGKKREIIGGMERISPESQKSTGKAMGLARRGQPGTEQVFKP